MVLGQGYGGWGGMLGWAGQRRGPAQCSHPRNTGRRLGSRAWTVDRAHFQYLLHVTPASSACPQFVTPHLEKLQRKMDSSVPLQATSSIQILPVPVGTSQHSFLADMQESRTEDKQSTAVSVLDQAVPGSAGPSPHQDQTHSCLRSGQQ